MKRTKSMFYRETVESRELFLFTVNESAIYPQLCAIVRNLNRKYSKGIYNPEKAIDAFYYAIESANMLYNKYFGYSFSVTDRFSAAIMTRDYFTENIEKGDM